MNQRALLAVLSFAIGCNSLAGVDELVDHPCSQEVCPPDQTDAALTKETGADSSVPVDSMVSDGGVDTFVADTNVPDMFVPDTVVPDTAPPDAFDGGVCGGAPTALIPIISGAGGYAIAATEVTRAQYGAFLAAAPSIAQPTECAWNTSFTPPGWTAPTSDTDCALPVVNVDWCDAWAYCKWAGRRLCAGIGGVAIAPDGVDVKDPAKDEWHRVCTANGTTDYAYGPDHTPGVCVDDDYDGNPSFTSADVARPVASATGCKGPVAPYASVFDMTGNVREWEGACDTSGAPEAHICRTRGGSFAEPNLSCNTGTSFRRDTKLNNVGIRCCATL
jgi:formylglycine-generating enzyme